MKKLWFTSQLNGLDYTEKEVYDAYENNKLLQLTIYVKAICNAKCPSCFITSTDKKYAQLALEQYGEILEQSKELGLKSVKISGAGEPLIVKETLKIIEWCAKNEIKTIVYTNGTALGNNSIAKNVYEMSSFELIDFLQNHLASIVYKMNSANEEIQDYLLGVEGLSANTYRGLFNLLYKGYNKDNRLALQTIITPYNCDETIDLYRFSRRNGIIPYFETVLRKEKAADNKDLYLEDDQIKAIFTKLSSLDREEYALDWFPVPSYVNFQCTELMYGFLIDHFGYARICPGIWESLGNTNEKRINELWNDPQIVSVRKGLFSELKGKCANCKTREDGNCMYGCRAYAYINNGDILGEYSECWWNS